jgi:two-component system sensor histidine kinase UhpB
VGTIGLAATFAIIGGVFSIVINLAVVTAALSPLDDIIATAEKVRAGDYSARIGADPMRDRELEQIVLSFNGALDQVEADRHEIKKLVNSVIEAQEDERKRIARELHDDTSQVLFAQLLRVSAMKMSENPEIREMAEQLETMLAESMEAVRRLGLELRPPSLDDLGLVEATGALVQRMAARSGIEIGFVASGLRERLDPAVELVLYRVAQEALTNMWKHAKATSASVSIRRQNGSVELIIDDNGRGFDVGVDNISDGKGLGLGLFGMQERVELVNGNLEVIGNMNPGTRVRARIPLEN